MLNVTVYGETGTKFNVSPQIIKGQDNFSQFYNTWVWLQSDEGTFGQDKYGRFVDLIPTNNDHYQHLQISNLYRVNLAPALHVRFLCHQIPERERNLQQINFHWKVTRLLLYVMPW